MQTTRSHARLAVGAAAAFALALLSGVTILAQQPALDKFFSEFGDEWVRMNPSQAASTRYFKGEEQDRFEQQITADTPEWRQRRIRLAKRGLDDLKKFDRSRMTNVERVSADLMQWQLDLVVRAEPFADFDFPLNQFNGTNVNLVNTLTVTHPLQTEKDAVNYIARLRLIGARMNEATAEAKTLAGKGLIPPRFILQSTITQMQRFIDSPAAQNPFVTAYAERIAGGEDRGRRRVSGLARGARADPVAGAEHQRQRGPLAIQERPGGVRVRTPPIYDDDDDAGGDSPARAPAGAED
jgi:uncharacterized protein (DUF885 family)